MLRRLTIRPAAACALGALAFPFPARCADRNDKPLGAWPIQSIEDALPVASLEDKVRDACGLKPSHPLTLEHMYGGKVEGKTLLEAGLKIGDSVRVLL